MKNKIIGFVLAIMLTFGAFALTACPNDTPTLAEYQIAAIAALHDYANDRGEENFTQENWQLIQNHVSDGVAAIIATGDKESVRVARDGAMAAVGEISKEDFILRILESEITINYGEHIFANVEFRNQSGQGHEISWGHGFMPLLLGSHPSFNPPPMLDWPQPRSKYIANNGVLRNLSLWGDFWNEYYGPQGIWLNHFGNFGLGKHRLSFYFGFEAGKVPYEIWSNIVIVNVV